MKLLRNTTSLHEATSSGSPSVHCLTAGGGGTGSPSIHCLIAQQWVVGLLPYTAGAHCASDLLVYIALLLGSMWRGVVWCGMA